MLEKREHEVATGGKVFLNDVRLLGCSNRQWIRTAVGRLVYTSRVSPFHAMSTAALTRLHTDTALMETS